MHNAGTVRSLLLLAATSEKAAERLRRQDRTSDRSVAVVVFRVKLHNSSRICCTIVYCTDSGGVVHDQTKCGFRSEVM